MDLTKKVLNVAIAFSMVMLSLGVFIYSIRDSKAIAAPEMTPDGYVVAGSAAFPGGDIAVIGYNPKTKDSKVLAYKRKALRDFLEN